METTKKHTKSSLFILYGATTILISILLIILFFVCIYFCKIYNIKYDELYSSLKYLILLLITGFGLIFIGIRLKNKFERLFLHCQLYINNDFPVLKNTVHTSLSTKYYFTIPVGLSMNDFFLKKDNIEQFLGNHINIIYENKFVIIEELFN